MSKFTFGAYLRDRRTALVIFGVALLIALGFCGAFRLRIEVILFILLPILLAALGVLWYEYNRRKRFYEKLRKNLDQLDQAYLVTETLERPNFLEGEILHDTCYEIDKSMLENISKLTKINQDFREYIELWIHEIKTPLTALGLLVSRDKQPELTQELARIDNLAEQVLYFMRAQSPEQDYLLVECNIGEVVKAVLQVYRTQIQLRDVKIVAKGLDQKFHSDKKWLQFMISQILANALKYGASEISFQMEQSQKTKILKVRDNGVGIPAEDLPRVFEKTFTGQNGREKTGIHSTGMGLYLVKTLCDKMGHRVEIDSKTGKKSYTEVKIYFGEHDYYKNVR